MQWLVGRHRPTFVAVGLVAAMGAICAVAAPPKTSKQPPPKLPDLATPQAKLEYIGYIRSQFPALRRTTNYSALELDEHLEAYVLKETKGSLAPLIDDEAFLRRVCLDLTGKIPPREVIAKFVTDTSRTKRARVIDELLTSEDFARRWARYWRTVVFHESTASPVTVNPKAFEDWLFDEFKAGSPWDYIVAQMLSAAPQRNPAVRPEQNGWNQNHGPNNFILAAERNPGIIASNTARFFMGISIQCAECHDHPFDNWKREQFHELAAFFSPGKYYMTDQNDPKERHEMQAKFLLGETPPEYLKADHRRVAMAGYLMYNPENYWFARAYVNRIWNELVGDGFYSVDSLGPDKEVVHQLVVNRLAATFRYNNFDIRWLFRTIMNSRAYQRESRVLKSSGDLFTATRATRLRPYEVADNVELIVGANEPLRRGIDVAFEQNPSVPQRDLEGSIQQALLMMNNSTLHSRLAGSPLMKELLTITDDDELIRQAFLGLLARKPDDAELKRYRDYLKAGGKREEAVEDIVWVLINSAEFITRI